MQVEIEHLKAADYMLREKLDYVDTHKLPDLYDKMFGRAHLILVGPKGTGKSYSVANFAQEREIPIISFDCSEDVRRSHLIGHNILRGDSTPFILGPLTSAFEVANEHGSCILNLEEVNALTPQMQKILNPLTDFRGKLTVPEAGRIFQLREGAKLWVACSMNTSVYGGVYELNEDLKSRFRMITLGYPETKTELKILQSKSYKIEGNRNDAVLKSLCAVAHETRQKQLEYPLSTRDLLQIAEDAQEIDLETALKLSLGKFEGEDRATVKARMMSQFQGVEL